MRVAPSRLAALPLWPCRAAKVRIATPAFSKSGSRCAENHLALILGGVRFCDAARVLGFAIPRKLRALGAVFLDPAATEHEKANAKRLKERLATFRRKNREPVPLD
jgi:hypothetical protein